MVVAEQVPGRGRTIYNHGVNLYNAMLEGSEDSIWEGMLTHLVEDIGAAGYYTPITRMLKVMGCIQLIRRGGGNPPVPSRWRLNHPPEVEAYDYNVEVRRPPTNLQLAQTVRDLNERVQEMEETVKAIYKRVFPT